MNKYSPFLTQITRRLARGSDTAALDAQVLLAHVLGRTRSWVMAHPEFALSSDQKNQVDQALEQLENGQPLPYVLGSWEFFGLDFALTPAVLIPRPETELLVEKALQWLRAQGQTGLKAADIGAGSGCIAIALAVNSPGLHVIASDISSAALQVARQNARAHGVAERVHLVQADLLSAFSPGLDLVCANLPYIPTSRLASLAVYGCEPTLALDGGEHGLTLIHRLLQQAKAILRRGCLLLEIEASQGEAARSLAQEAFPQARVEVVQDLAGNDRMVRVLV